MEFYVVEKASFDAYVGKVDLILEKLDQLNDPKRELVAELIDVEEAARILKVSRRTIFNYMEDGYIPHTKVKRKVYFKVTDIKNFLNSNLKRTR